MDHYQHPATKHDNEFVSSLLRHHLLHKKNDPDQYNCVAVAPQQHRMVT